MKNVEEDLVAMTLYIIAALIMTAFVFLYFALSGGTIDKSFFLYDVILTIGVVPVFIFCIILVAVGRIIDLLNQINQKLENN